MSEHHHDHDGDCHCKDCESKKNDGEKTSIEEAGGVAVGLTGHIHGYNADVEARIAKAMMSTGKWVEKESGTLLGHIKAAIYTKDGKGVTLNLTDMESGVEHHGMMDPQEVVDFSFMSAVLDVDSHELEHIMMDALEDSGIDYHLDGGHHHEHDHEHGHHGNHHDHSHGHDHHHDHDHGHHNHSHHNDNKEEVCHCQACEDRRNKNTDESEKVSFWKKIRRSK